MTVKTGAGQTWASPLNHNFVSGGDTVIKSHTGMYLNTEKAAHISSKQGTEVNSASSIDLKSAQSINLQSNDNIRMISSSNFNLQPTTHLQLSASKFLSNSHGTSSFETIGSMSMSSRGADMDVEARTEVGFTAGSSLSVTSGDTTSINVAKTMSFSTSNNMEIVATSTMHHNSAGLQSISGSTVNLLVGGNRRRLENDGDLKFHSPHSLEYRRRHLLYGSSGATTSQASLDTEGDFSIGRDRGLEKLHVNGAMTISGRITAAEFVSPSDARLKSNVTILGKGMMDRISRLAGVEYTWSRKAKNLGVGRNSNATTIGVIAQDIEAVFPSLVKQWSNPNHEHFKTVDYGKLNAILIQALKENQQYLLSLQQRVVELKRKKLSRLQRRGMKTSNVITDQTN